MVVGRCILPRHDRSVRRIGEHLAFSVSCRQRRRWRIYFCLFFLACILIGSPLLIAEFLIGRHSQRSPPFAAGIVAMRSALSPRWNVIGVLGTISAFLIISYYTVIAGWVAAYTW